MLSTMEERDDGEYIDYEAFLAPNFNPSLFANSLVLATNNPNDIPLDLATPLSRVLFDTQEIDSHIDTLTTQSAVPLLNFTKTQTDASHRILLELDGQIKALNDSYAQLEKDVVQKHAEADQVRKVASRLWETLRLSRAVSRCLQLGRQLQLQLIDARDDPAALTRCAHTILSVREILERNGPSEEGYNLDRITAIQSLQKNVLWPSQNTIQRKSEVIIHDFNASNSAADSGREKDRSLIATALATLYLLSPSPKENEKWDPTMVIQAVELHIRGALQASIAALGRGLGQFNGQVLTLEKSLTEVSSRCHNIMHLEAVLEATKAPQHPLMSRDQQKLIQERGKNILLQPVLDHLETSFLASYFWRTLAGSVSTRVQEMSQRGSSAARSLKLNKGPVQNAIRECVLKGSEKPILKGQVNPNPVNPDQASQTKGWEREIAVMVGSVINNLSR